MTRKQAFDFYNELEKTGKLKEFQEKDPSKMTSKEKELFYFNDGKHFYNLCAGYIDELLYSDKLLEKSFSELSDEELKELGIL